MNYTYTCEKFVPKKNDVKEAAVYFRNGDFFGVSGSEIVDFKLEYYDKLVRAERGFIPYVKSGFIKMNLGEKKKKDCDFLVYDADAFKRKRKEYVEKRCCDDAPYYFAFYDENNWYRSFLADTIVSVDGEYITFTFIENATMGASDSDRHTVNVCELRKNTIMKINLDFENCDCINVYEDEIEEICLNFKEELAYESEYLREVSSGYLRLKFDPDFIELHANENIYNYGKKPSIKKLEERIVGKGESEIDICHLYVTYARGGCSFYSEECITIPELAKEISDEEDGTLKKNEDSDFSDDDEEYEYDDCEPFVSGYAKRDKDGSILIVFGNPIDN